MAPLSHGHGPVRQRRRAGIIVSLLLCLPGLSPAQADKAPWVSVLVELASSLSRNDAAGALEAFDSSMKNHGKIEEYLKALTAQSDILCSIEVIADKDEVIGDKDDPTGRTLDVDWYMQLKSQADNGPTERRRERVVITLRMIRGRWKIVSFSPLEILSPIHL